MPALTAAVQWSRLQGGSRLAKTLSLHPQPSLSWVSIDFPIHHHHHHQNQKKRAFVPEVSVRRALGWKKPLHTDVGGGETAAKT